MSVKLAQLETPCATQLAVTVGKWIGGNLSGPRKLEKEILADTKKLGSDFCTYIRFHDAPRRAIYCAGLARYALNTGVL